MYPDREVVALKTSVGRQETKLVMGRHKYNLKPGDRVMIVEDVINNLSTAPQAIDLIEQGAATAVGILSLFCYRPTQHSQLPIISVEVGSISDYHQHDPSVASDVDAGKVVWEPKSEWVRLMQIMRESQSA